MNSLTSLKIKNDKKIIYVLNYYYLDTYQIKYYSNKVFGVVYFHLIYCYGYLKKLFCHCFDGISFYWNAKLKLVRYSNINDIEKKKRMKEKLTNL